MADTENKTVGTLLQRFGVKKKLINALNPDRAKKKLIHRLSQQGVPEVLSSEEAVLIKGLGFEIPASATVSGASAEGQAETSTVVAVLDTEEDEDSDDDSVDEDAEEDLDDDDLDEEAVANADPGDDAPVPTEAGAPKSGKGEKKKASKDPKQPKKAKSGSSVAMFTSVFARVKSLPRPDALAAAVKVGMTEVTARTYMTWAKQKKPNPFGFHLTEAKNDKKVKILTKVPD